jgi:hypothetical protein
LRCGSHALGPINAFKDSDMIQIDVIDDHSNRGNLVLASPGLVMVTSSRLRLD